MRTLGIILALLAALSASAQVRPAIQGAPQNAASYAPPNLPNGAIAQGSMFILKGTDFGTCDANNVVIASAFPLTSTMRNVQTRVTVGSKTTTALMIYVVVCRPGAPDQLAAILPSDTPTGNGIVQVLVNGVASDPAPIRVTARSFGIFTWNQAGTGPVIVQNFIDSLNTPTNGLFEAANPGQTEILWGVGLGAVTPASELAGPVPGDIPVQVTVLIGGREAEVLYRGRSGCCAGIDQVVFKVPQNVSGCYVSVALSVNNVLSNVGTMSIAPSGKVCAEASRLSSTDLSRIPRTGAVTVGDISLLRLNVSAGALQGTLDTGSANFRRFANYQQMQAAASQSISGFPWSPTPGSCIVTPFTFTPGTHPLKAIFPTAADPAGVQVDAGASLRLVNPQGTQIINRQTVGGAMDGYYLPDGTTLGGGLPAASIPLKAGFLESGRITVDNGVGAAIGSFDASLTVPVNVPTWSNQNSINIVSRSQDLDVNWTGGSPNELAIISGSSADPAGNAGTSFLCVERASANTFRVPGYVLGALPVSGNSNGLSVGWLTFATTSANPARFTTTNLDAGFFNFINAQAKNLSYR